MQPLHLLHLERQRQGKTDVIPKLERALRKQDGLGQNWGIISLKYSITLLHDNVMTGTAVAAVLQSECRTVNVRRLMFLCSCRKSIKFSFLIVPNDVIVDNVHGLFWNSFATEIYK